MGAQVLLVGYESLNTSVPHWHAYLALQPAKLMKQVHLILSLEKKIQSTYFSKVGTSRSTNFIGAQCTFLTC